MQKLEKILEEIDRATDEYGMVDYINDEPVISKIRAKDIIRKHMKNEENILKFYYCESEDDYYLGQRVQNMYYAKYRPGGFTWFMSRYLPWGEEGYPSKPKEIPFLEWIEGFIRKHMNDGWISVDDRLPKTNGTYNVTRHIDGHFISDSAYFDGQNTWHSDNRVNHSRPYLTDVIAWRPLSEPYRPERSNDEKK